MIQINFNHTNLIIFLATALYMIFFTLVNSKKLNNYNLKKIINKKKKEKTPKNNETPDSLEIKNNSCIIHSEKKEDNLKRLNIQSLNLEEDKFEEFQKSFCKYINKYTIENDKILEFIKKVNEDNELKNFRESLNFFIKHQLANFEYYKI